MSFVDLFSIAGSVFLGLSGGAVLVFALARWLGGVWAGRILENERAARGRELELLVRRRDVYTTLAVSMRVFLGRHEQPAPDNREQFLRAYDEASIWAPDSVMNAVGRFLDLNRQNTALSGSVVQETLQAAFASCITEMRKDAGFPNTTFSYRVVSF